MLEFFKDLFDYMRQRKKVWLLPILFFLIILGGLIILAQSSVIAPFIYTLF